MSLRSVIIFLCALPLSLLAQDNESGWYYRAWQTEDGLPANNVSGVTQGPDGYLWISTNAGTIRFNGHKFHPLPLRDIPDLPSRQVHVTLVDRSDNLWLGLERGPLVRIGRDTYKAFDSSNGLFPNRTLSITEDKQSRIWVSFTSRACLIDGDSVTRFTTKDGIPSGRNSQVVCDSEGQIWMTSDKILGRLHEQGFQETRTYPDAVRIAPSRESGLWLTHQSKLFHFKAGYPDRLITQLPPNTSVNAIFEDKKGALWLGTQGGGLLRFFQNNLERIPTSHPSITSVAEDHEGNVWAGSAGGGLNLILPRSARFIDKSSGLPFGTTRSVTLDHQDRLWATTHSGQIGFEDDGKWHLFRNRPADLQATCIAADSQGGIWVGSKKQGLYRVDGDRLIPLESPNPLSNLAVRALLPSSDGDLWITADFPCQLFRLRDGKITAITRTVETKALRAISETSDGTIWVGSADGYLLRVENDRLVDQSSLDGPSLRSIRTLHATPDGSLWIGFAGDGLGHYKDGNFSLFTIQEGLHDDYISQIQHDQDGALWIAANRGLFKVEIESLLSNSTPLRCQTFGRGNGLPSIQPSRDYSPSSVSRNNCEQLYFTTLSGLLVVNPEQSPGSQPPPPVVLESALLDNKPIATFKARAMLDAESQHSGVDLSQPNPKIDIPPDHDKLAISFAALTFTSPENSLIRYRLTPIDKEWQEAENDHTVSFSRLPAGKYQFQVIASNGTGNWNETGATLEITVAPFFWETWWFKLGVGSLTAFIAGGFVFFNLRKRHRRQLRQIEATRALEQERSRIARDIHDDLGATLTRITLLSQNPPPDTDAPAGETFSQIHSSAQHLMRSMEEVVWAVNPEHDTFDALANYLSNYGQGFLRVADVRCRLEMPVSLPERSLSAQLRHNLFLAFKEALNNAVKYAEATVVHISLEPHDAHFVLKVADKGKGIDPNTPPDPLRPTAGNGLANMKNRLDEIGGRCTVHSVLGEGTTIEFEVPFTLPPSHRVTETRDTPSIPKHL
ncbi:MAG: sensor histidine kinase [Akkermansiaceae bacterium]